MKMPEPIGSIQVEPQEYGCHPVVRVVWHKRTSEHAGNFYSEAQLREALAQQESEIQRLKSLLRTADIRLAQIEAKDMQDNPDDYVM